MCKLNLLLLSCCAPCSCAVIEKLAKDNCQFTVLFYNPNIDSEPEYLRRLSAQKALCDALNVPFVDLPYEGEVWQRAIVGFEQEPERGKRCSICFLLRLRRAAKYAKANGFNSFSSVLGISGMKDLGQVNAAAKLAAQEESIAYDFTNWRKGGLEQRRPAIIKELDLYCQNYCGCLFSRTSKPS